MAGCYSEIGDERVLVLIDDGVAAAGHLTQGCDRRIGRRLPPVRALGHANPAAHTARGLAAVPAPTIGAEHSSASELHAHEVVRRPRPRDAEIESALTLRFL